MHPLAHPTLSKPVAAEPGDRSRWVGWLSFSVSLAIVLVLAVAASLNDHAHEEALPPPPALPFPP
jgi:hypothetical protein